MMGIIQVFAEQEMMTENGTLLGAMSGSATYKATTCAEEEVSIVVQQTGESIKSKAVDGQGYGSREDRLFIKRNPMGVMVI
jgi:hypothetical protein